MSNVNVVVVSGNLTRDPEVTITPSGTTITKIGIAVNRSYKPKDSDEYVEEVSFFDVTTFGNFAGLVGRKFRKGDSATIHGRLKQERWETEAGENRSRVVIHADQIDSEAFFRTKEDENAAPAATEAPAASQPAPVTAPPASPAAGTVTPDDDIPF